MDKRKVCDSTDLQGQNCSLQMCEVTAAVLYSPTHNNHKIIFILSKAWFPYMILLLLGMIFVHFFMEIKLSAMKAGRVHASC